MSKLFDALRILSPEDEEEYSRIRRAVPRNESALNAATTQQQTPQQNPGLFAGVAHGLTGQPSTGTTIPYNLGLIPGSIIRSRMGLPISQSSGIAEEEARNRMEESRLQEYMRENPSAKIRRRTIGDATVEIPESEEEFETKMERDRRTALSKAEVKEGIESKKGSKMAMQSANLVASAANRLAQTYADAYREGGVGDITKATISDLAGKVGGDWGEKYPNTAALLGQRTEMITKMMPILTQQGDKPGSVRLVTTVFERLEKTMPANNTPPKPARKMMETTIKNMYGFAKAINDMGITNEMVEGLPDDKLKALGDSIAAQASKVAYTPQEKKEMDQLVAAVVEPIDKLIAEKEGKTLKTKSGTSFSYRQIGQ